MSERGRGGRGGRTETLTETRRLVGRPRTRGGVSSLTASDGSLAPLVAGARSKIPGRPLAAHRGADRGPSSPAAAFTPLALATAGRNARNTLAKSLATTRLNFPPRVLFIRRFLHPPTPPRVTQGSSPPRPRGRRDDVRERRRRADRRRRRRADLVSARSRLGGCFSRGVSRGAAKNSPRAARTQLVY